MADDNPHGERITEAEQAVMEALWARSPLTANEVADVVSPQRGWSLPTVKTLLSRLVVKQALATEPDGKRYLYRPLIANRLCRRRIAPAGRSAVWRIGSGPVRSSGRGGGADRQGSCPDRGAAQGASRARGGQMSWLVDTLIATGALIALVLVLRRPVSQIFGPAMAYALWALPLLRLITPPLVLPAPEVAPPAVVAANDLVLTGPSVAPAEQAFSLAALEPVLLGLWLAGTLAYLGWRAAGYIRLRRELLTDARPVGTVGDVRLIESPQVITPLAFGIRDKVVALPVGFMTQPDRTARDLAIVHELEHHRGRDLAVNLAMQPLLAS
ncbi:MAG: BlaI/MecI/CopY family transcriptional regulator, partial [Brevundimonas sp.]|nr:BlaI/MecI/CopY family transcriptional regulator [Brevundimonas sp.]